MAESQEEAPQWDPKIWLQDKSHKPVWYIPTLDNIDEPARELLEKYSGIPHDKVIPHIVEVRDKAFDIFPYPCIGLFRFLDFSIRKSPVYDEVLQRVKNGQKFLDMGCCFAQDIRALVADGAPAENTYGADLEMKFMDVGYDLFLDKDTLKTKFYPCDIFDSEADIKELNHSINIVHASSFFHLFDWTHQVLAAKRIVEILKKEPDVLIVGRQLGAGASGEIESRVDNKTRFWHNAESFKKLWKQVGDETGSKWEVDVTSIEYPIPKIRLIQTDDTPNDTQVLAFTIRRA